MCLLSGCSLLWADSHSSSRRSRSPCAWTGCCQPRSPARSRPAQQHYLSLAQAGVARAEQRWRDRRLGWYDARLGDRERYPLATIWDIVPLFESLDAIAIAQPTPANRRAVARFAAAPSAT